MKFEYIDMIVNTRHKLLC